MGDAARDIPRGKPGGRRTASRGRSPAVHGDGVVAGLLLLLLHGSDEVDHALALGRDAHLGPAVEVELADCAGLIPLAGQGLWGGGISVALPARGRPQATCPGPQAPQASLRVRWGCVHCGHPGAGWPRFLHLGSRTCRGVPEPLAEVPEARPALSPSPCRGA